MAVKSTIQARAARASMAGLASTAMAIALQIITVPVVLTYWGSEKYGVWLAVMAAFMMVRAIDGGYVTYVGTQLNVLYHERQEELRHTLGSSLTICLGLGALQILLCIGLLATSRAPALLGVAAGSEFASEAGLGLIVLILAWVLTGSFLSIIHRLLVPAGMLANVIWLGMGFQAAQFAVIMVAAFAGASVLQAAAVYAGVQAALYVASVQYVRWKLPQFYPWWRGGRMSAGLRDLYRSVVLTANTAAQQAGNSGIVLVVSSLLGSTTVPAFTTVRTLANLGTTLGNVFANALTPEVVRYYATRQHGRLSLGFRATALFGGLAVNLSLLAVLPFAETIYAMWTRGVVSFDRQLFLYLVAGVSVWSGGLAYLNFLVVTNSLRAQFLLTLVRSTIVLGVGVGSIGTLGLPGVGLGVFLAEIVGSILATFLFVPRMVAAEGVSLLRFHQADGFLTSLPVIVISLFGALSGTLPLSLILGAAAAVLLFGWYTWLRLPHEARVRATSIIRRQP